MKNPYLYTLTNMSLNLNGYYTRTVDYKINIVSFYTHTVYYIVDISLRKDPYQC